MVYIPEQKQITRLMERDLISREEAISILNAQMPIEDKIALADFVIKNDGTCDETKKQVEKFFKDLKEL